MSFVGPSAIALRNALSNTQKAVTPGFWAVGGVAASQTNQNMSFVNIYLAGRYIFQADGLFVGFSREGNAAVTAGTLTIYGTRDGSQIQNVGISSNQNGRHTFTVPIAVSGGQGIGFQYTTDVSYVGPSSFALIPLVVFNA
jgi:hypothetical protein